ncbi:MAG: N-carbamoylputrescine amidase [Hyphomicrobiaceae bacterium]
MARTITVAATQMAESWDLEVNRKTAERLIREAAGKGAQVILVQELFETPYFCIEQDPAFSKHAHKGLDNPLVKRFAALAAELGVVLPISFYEKTENALFNSIAVADADGRIVGHYRKSHIPDGPGYQEKFYFSPGDTGFRVHKTRFGTIGIGICWDQWFPETARALSLLGAEILLYPTAIGSEPQAPDLDSRDHWQRVMQGHAGANMRPLVASNRIGKETVGQTSLTFYGSSFIADQTGAKVAEAGRTGEAVLTATFDLEAIEAQRIAWGIFRDRRPDLYGIIARHEASPPLPQGWS